MLKKCVVILLALILLVPAIPDAQALTDMSGDDFSDIISTWSINDSIPSYNEYLALHPEARAGVPVVIDAAGFVRYEEAGLAVEPPLYSDFEGMPGISVLTGETGLIEYEFHAPQTGFYSLLIEYYPIEGKGSAIARGFFLDGELPYNELAITELSRVWQNDSVMSGSVPVWEKDNQGNDLKPSMKEAPRWTSAYLHDSGGYIRQPLSLYLTEGEHTLSIYSLREPLLLRRILLADVAPVQNYLTVRAMQDASGAVDSHGAIVPIQAENAVRTSSQMLYPVQDQSSPAVTPSSPKSLLNNTIGGYGWRLAGQWIEWDFTVPETGYYEITMYNKQNFKRGVYVSRKITIDGETPFTEMEDYGFTYAQSWRTDRLTDSSGEPLKFFLEAGSHTLRMEAVLGGLAGVVSTVRDAVYDLNAIYRSVIARTGVAPDKFADYQLERTLPGLTAQMISVRDRLSWTINELRRVAGRQSERERVLVTMRDQLNELIRDNEKFPRMIGSFKVNVRACGTWLNEALDQPLQLDTIYIHSPDTNITIKKDGIFSKIAYEISRLFYSFIIDYNRVGSVSDSKDDETITLWIGSGRDQANIVKSMIDRSFTKDSLINVNVMLVDMSTLLQASLAGQGPDVAIQVSGELPMNFGLRGSVADLSVFDKFEQVRARFDESVMTAYEFGGECYALPETMVFPMMFYRKDILAEMGLELPQTWDEVSVVMSELAFNHMEFGMLPSEQVFSMLLYQNGGQYYNESATRSALDSEQAIHAFRRYTEFYTDYKLDRETSVEERFRTGETPIIIADYTFYNNLQISAPDLKGVWGFAPVPGTVRSDDSLDRTVSVNAGGAAAATTMIGVTGGNGAACVMMESSKKKEQVWEFMQWWTSAETQLLFGREMESLMGPSARVPTANLEAFNALPWPAGDFAALSEQFKSVRGIPQVPGGYFTYRNVNNAFYSVTTPLTSRPSSDKRQARPREELMDKVILINDEIRYKRIEFGLPLE